jgi:hypothetical protein
MTLRFMPPGCELRSGGLELVASENNTKERELGPKQGRFSAINFSAE